MPTVHFKVTASPLWNGVLVQLVPAEAHHQLGRIERHLAILRLVTERIVDQHAAVAPEQLDDCLSAALNAKNKLVRRGGRSPEQAVFGRTAAWPSQLTDDSTDAAAQHNMSTDQTLALAEQMRWDALRAFAEVEQSQSLMQAIHRKTATLQASDLVPGQRIAYWRDAKPRPGRSGRANRPGYIIATFLMYDPGKSSGPDGEVRQSHTNA